MNTETTVVPICACGNPVCVQGSQTLRVSHGHYSMYTNHQCRCDLCRTAYRLYRQKYRVVPVEQCGCGNATCTRKTRREVQHGLSCYFRHKCRCGVCMEGMREYQRNRRAAVRAAKAGNGLVPTNAAADLVRILQSPEMARFITKIIS